MQLGGSGECIRYLGILARAVHIGEVELFELLHPTYLPFGQVWLGLKVYEGSMIGHHLSDSTINIWSPAFYAQNNCVFFALMDRIVLLRSSQLPAKVCNRLETTSLILLEDTTHRYVARISLNDIVEVPLRHDQNRRMTQRIF